MFKPPVCGSLPCQPGSSMQASSRGRGKGKGKGKAKGKGRPTPHTAAQPRSRGARKG